MDSTPPSFSAAIPRGARSSVQMSARLKNNGEWRSRKWSSRESTLSPSSVGRNPTPSQFRHVAPRMTPFSQCWQGFSSSGKVIVGAVILLLLMACPSWATIVAGPHNSNDLGSGTAASTVATALTQVPIHSLIVCSVSIPVVATFSSVADNKDGPNTPYTAAIAIHSFATTDQQVGIYYFENANPTTQQDVTVTLTITGGNRQFLAIACKSYTGVALSSSLDLHPAARDYNSTALAPQLASNSTPAVAGELVLSVAQMFGNQETAGTNYTLGDSCTTTLLFSQTWIQTTATATNGAFGSTDTAWTEELVSFEPPGAVSSTTSPKRVVVY